MNQMVLFLLGVCVIAPNPVKSEVNKFDDAAAFVHVERDAENRTYYIAGEDLFPECKQVTKTRTVFEEITRCVLTKLEQTEPLSEMSNYPERNLDFSVLNRGSLSVATATEMHNGVTVKDSNVAVSIHKNGQIVQVKGRLNDLSHLKVRTADSKYIDADEAINAAQLMLGIRLSGVDRYFDDDRNSFVSHLTDTDGINHYLFDERLGLIFEHDVYFDLDHSTVVKRVPKSDYRNGSNKPTGSSIASILFGSESQADDCEISFDHGADHGQGEPRLELKAPGVSGNTLAVTADCDHHTFLGIAAPHEDVTNAYFWLHDLADFSNTDFSEYKSYIPWTSNRPLVVRVLADGGACGVGISPGCAYQSKSNHYLELARVNDGVSDLNVMAHEHGHTIHHRYGFGHVNDFLSRALGEGFAEHHVLRYALYRRHFGANRFHDPFDVLSYNSSIARSGAHSSVTNRGQIEISGSPFSATSSMCSRSSRPHECGFVVGDIYWELAWNRCRTPYTTIYGSRCDSGERIIDPGPAAAPEIPSDATSLPAHVIFPSIATGELVADDFGLQAWDVALETDAIRLANRAFTNAIAAMENGDGPAQFMNAVAMNYLIFRLDDEITRADFRRVISVLNHHCLGWGHGCNNERILPQQKLPVERSDRESFAECQSNNCGELALVEDWVLSDSAQILPHECCVASPNGFQFVRFAAATDAFVYELDIPKSGLYRFEASARALGGSSASAFVDYNDPGAGSEVCSGTGDCTAAHSASVLWSGSDVSPDWGWSIGPYVHLEEGPQSVRIRHGSGTIGIEALFVRPARDNDGDGIPNIEDNCAEDSNPLQENLDGDGQGDVCDLDVDNDRAEEVCGIIGCSLFGVDNCERVYNPGQEDDDGDGIGNACDADRDGDGQIDAVLRL